jgi:hypothetical protein
MAVPTGAYVFRDFALTIDDVVVANQSTEAQLVPETAVETLKTLVPDGVVQDVGSTVWKFKLGGIQDNTASTGIAGVLRAAAGTGVVVVLTPKAGTGNPQATFTVICLQTEFGGKQGDWNTFEIELPVNGQPVFGTAT